MSIKLEEKLEEKKSYYDTLSSKWNFIDTLTSVIQNVFLDLVQIQ